MSSRSKILMAMFFALDLSLKHDSLCQLGPSPISPHGPAIGKATFQMMGVFAERSMIERVRAGIVRARRAAPNAARPSAAPDCQPRRKSEFATLWRLLARPRFHKIAATFHAATGTVQRIASG